MYIQVNFSNFYDHFQAIRKDNFTYEGLKVLFDYLEDYETEDEKGIELDVIALCCEFSEVSIKEALKDYNLESIEDLKNNTTVLNVNDETIIYRCY